MSKIIDDGLYWLKPHETDRWTIGQAMVWANHDVTFYLVGFDYGRNMTEFEVGEQIVRSTK